MRVRALLCLLIAMPLSLVACEPAEAPAAMLTLTSKNSMEFEAEGGKGVITYTLENTNKETKLAAISQAEWITNIVVAETITFDVKPNEAKDQRTTRIYVSYGDRKFSVFIRQQGTDRIVNFEAGDIVGVYYGTNYSQNYNICLYLTDVGFTSDGYTKPGGTYYMLDLYTAKEPKLDAEGWMTIPEGTYKYDGTDSMKDKTLGATYSAYFKVNEEGNAFEAQAYYDAAEFVVTSQGVILTAVIDGVKHVARYERDNTFYAGLPIKLEGGTVEATALVGDYYGTQYSQTYNYNIFLSDLGYDAEGYAQAGAYYFSLDLYGIEPEIDDEGYLHIPEGKYTYDLDDNFGEWEISRAYSGAYKVYDDGSDYEWIEVFSDATVEVSKSGIKAVCIVAGGEFRVTYSGEPKFYVGTTTYAAKAKSTLTPEKKSAEIK